MPRRLMGRRLLCPVCRGCLSDCVSAMAIGRTFLWSSPPHSSYGPVTFNGRNYSSSSRRSHCGSASRRQDIQYRPFMSVVPLTDPLVRQQREWTWSSVIRIPGVVYYSANISAFYYFATSNFFLLIYLPFRFSLLISSAAYKGIFGGGA